MKKAKSERKKRSVTGRGVAGPDLLSMVMQKGRPRLASWPGSTDLPHVLLNGAFRKVKAQIEQFAPDPLCSEDGGCPLPSP
jgi:hypothetical protein